MKDITFLPLTTTTEVNSQVFYCAAVQVELYYQG